MDAPDPSFQYQVIRDEIRAEHSLIANRLTWYVTSQSFLVTAFAISQGNGFAWFHWFPTVLLPFVGLVSSVLVFTEFSAAFSMERPSWVERRGLLFPQVMPLLFGSVWLAVFVGSRFQ